MAKGIASHISDVSRLAGAVIVAAIVALLSFVGSVGGTYWATRLQREDRESEARGQTLSARFSPLARCDMQNRTLNSHQPS